MTYFLDKYANKNLIESAVLNSILEDRINSIIVTDKNNIILFSNEAASNIFGYKKEEIIGENITLLMQSPYNREIDSIINFEKDSLGKRKDDSIFPINISITQITIDNNTFNIILIRDITEKKEIEELRAAYILMQSEIKTKNNFLSILSHELRTPLHSILGLIEGLIRGLDGPLLKAQELLLQDISNSGKELLAFTDKMLQLSKITPSEYNLTIEPCSMMKTIAYCIEMISFIAEQKHLKIDNKILEDVLILGNSKNLKEIFLNLLTNAVKFSEKGTITIFATYLPKKVSISITDSGIGINEKKLSELFIPFWMFPKGDLGNSKGLSLALTKLLLELQGGKIEASSKEGVGSTFTIHLPTIEKP